ncbi:M4 family metallopeptidase [Rhizocola hellebori]|uniref:M4 family metallopeptidase n=1 Tax=Rhizocola hellebori TaxID=1392758 RepID=UPI001EF2A19E|nr:M4 family metallopeptidase [Rhizocola hellebori]
MNRRTPIASLAVLTAAVIGAVLATPQAVAVPAPAGDISVTAAADAFAASNTAALFKSPDDVMIREAVTTGTHGLNYVSYQRTYRGLQVVGGDAVITTDASGKVLNTTAAQDQVISVGTTPSISAAQAAATARTQLATVQTASTPTLVVLAWGTPRLAWEVKLTGTKANGAESVPSVYVDAMTGKIADSVDLVRDGTGVSFYVGTVNINTSGSGTSWSMQDGTRPGIRCGGQNGTTFTGTDDSWGNGSGTNLETACVDALYAVQREWDMLGAWLGRNGINGSGSGFPIRVGLNDANAFWNGSNTSFGHNSANTQQATSIDVVAHEFGHAIFQTTPGGAGSGNENGGLNEGTGDIFGALTEAYANNVNDPPDFLVGEEVNLVGSGEIRNMFNPSAEGDPNCWSTAIPNTEVHAAAGPINHWFYLLARGSNPAGGPVSPTCNSSTVTGVGIQDAGRIYYNAMLAKTSTWRYANVRLASLNAAVNLFGANSAQCTQTKAAWNAISVPVQAGEPTCGGGGGGTTIYSDTFETATGWATAGGDTATTGAWERGDPAATTSGGVGLQLGTTVSGTNDLVTGAAAGAAAGDFDVDGGTTSIQSPTIALPATGTLTLNYSWYLAHLNNASSADFFRVSVVVGTTPTVVFTQAGSAANRAGAWTAGSVNISSFAGQTIRIRFEAADAATGSLIEAGVDNVTITQS